MASAIISADDCSGDGLAHFHITEREVRIVACVLKTDDAVSERAEIQRDLSLRNTNDSAGHDVTFMDRLHGSGDLCLIIRHGFFFLLGGCGGLF